MAVPWRNKKCKNLLSNIEKCMIRSRKLLSKYTQKTLQTAFFSEEKVFKVKELCNSYNGVFHVPKKTRKVDLPEERLLCEIEAFPKQMIVFVVISKASKTLIFLLTEYKSKFEVLL